METSFDASSAAVSDGRLGGRCARPHASLYTLRRRLMVLRQCRHHLPVPSSPLPAGSGNVFVTSLIARRRGLMLVAQCHCRPARGSPGEDPAALPRQHSHVEKLCSMLRCTRREHPHVDKLRTMLQSTDGSIHTSTTSAADSFDTHRRELRRSEFRFRVYKFWCPFRFVLCLMNWVGMCRSATFVLQSYGECKIAQLEGQSWCAQIESLSIVSHRSVGEYTLHSI